MSDPTPPISSAGRRLVGTLGIVVAVALVAVETSPADGASGLRGMGVAPPSSLYGPVGGEDPHAADDAEDGTAVPGVDPEQPAVEPVPPGAQRRVHVVAPGDTVGAVAEQHGIGPRALARANGHVSPDALRPGDELVLPHPAAPRHRLPEQAAEVDPELDRLLTETARAYGWNPSLVKAVAWVESRWDQHVVSTEQAIGVMQVQPDTADVVARRLGRPIDLHDRRDNVEAGVAYLDLLHERYGSDTRALLAAYHQGPRAVRERGIYPISHRYADRILHLRDTAFAGG
jgi:LysM repeat protein